MYRKASRTYNFVGDEPLGDAYSQTIGLSESLDVARSRAVDIVKGVNTGSVPKIAENVMVADELAISIAKDFKVNIKKNELIDLENFVNKDAVYMTKYLEINRLFVDCLQIATVSNRDEIESSLLLLDN
jgi:hypothetical protein